MQLQGDPIGVYIISVGILFALLFIIYLLAKKDAVPGQSGTLAQLGPYRNLSLLSDKGGMAKVYHAYHAEMGRECVLKVLRSDLLGDADTVKKFHREAELLKSIKRSYPEAPVVQVFSTGTIATEFVELPFIEMEYIPGRTDLSDFLKEQGKLQPATAEKIVVQVVRALMAAHGEGAIHRDLKPGNILLYNGDPEKAVVCDFGVAKQVSSKSVTMGGYGTAAYMSPEQCGGSGEFTQASDIYSLALIWYEMLTGSRLFEEDNAFVLMQKHKEEDPAPYIRDHIPARYHELFMQMLAKDAQTRPALETVLSVLSSASLQIVGYRPETIEIQTRNYKASTPLVGSKRNVAITSLVGLLFLLLVLTGYELYNKHLGGGGIAGIALQPTPTPMRVSAPETETPTAAWPPTPTPWSGRIAQVPTPTSTVVFSQEEEPGFLFAEPEPTQMEIEILNIQQPFHQGIELPPGEYHVEYSAEGYATQREWIELKPGVEMELSPVLQKSDSGIARPSPTSTRQSAPKKEKPTKKEMSQATPTPKPKPPTPTPMPPTPEPKKKEPKDETKDQGNKQPKQASKGEEKTPREQPAKNSPKNQDEKKSENKPDNGSNKKEKSQAEAKKKKPNPKNAGKEPKKKAKKQPPKKEDITVNLPGGVPLVLGWCPSGEFMMGSSADELYHEDDEVYHNVVITREFWIGKYEVTQEQWQAVMGSNPSKFPGPNRPVENITFYDCRKFIQQLNLLAKHSFRLPTEAEWEYACRAGTKTSFYWGNGENPTEIAAYAWYINNAEKETHPVGLKKPNPWGLYDMCGNVWEWCQDKYGNYSLREINDPQGLSSGTNRVIRGGAWDAFFYNCRSASRNWFHPSNASYNIGFRIVVAPSSE